MQDKRYWARTENWLEQRYAEIHPGHKANGKFRISGYQWRTLHFNDDTRQSTVKVMTAYREEEPDVVCLMQQPHCLAVPCKFHNMPFLIATPLQQFFSKDLLCIHLSIPSAHYVAISFPLQSQTFSSQPVRLAMPRNFF